MTDHPNPAPSTVRQICGLVMPISDIEPYRAGHWTDVRGILNETISSAGFDPQMVSDSDEVGVIHKSIVGNLDENPIVVCDVSGANPNVLFELGMRLAFDKATVIVKDDRTKFNFDTQVIEHLIYPHDLRFESIRKFQARLHAKLIATHTKSLEAGFTMFLGHFAKTRIVQRPEEDKTTVAALQADVQELLKELRAGNRQFVNAVGRTPKTGKVLSIDDKKLPYIPSMVRQLKSGEAIAVEYADGTIQIAPPDFFELVDRQESKPR